MPSLNQLGAVRRFALRCRLRLLNRVMKMSIHPTAQVSLTAKLDLTYPKGVHVGRFTQLAFGSTILCHDMCRGIYVDTVVGECCFIGARSIIMPGVSVGHHSIVAAGAVVTRDVPPHSIVGGNPAKIIRSNIETGPFGRFLSAGVHPAIREKYIATVKAEDGVNFVFPET